MIREPVIAGRFYPLAASECEAEANDCCRLLESDIEGLTTPTYGGIVPHAGWVCSGRVAGRVLAALHRTAAPRTIVLFGTMHHVRGRVGVLFPTGQWKTPLGMVAIDERLSERVLGHTNLIEEDPFAHEDEHSLEVQLPFVQKLFPGVPILPILVPPLSDAPAVGDAVGRTLREYRYDALVVGSTDLTHYGPSYGFTPEGAGSDGFAWAKDVNDRRIIDLILAMDADAIVDETARYRNACGGGAIAATIAAVRQTGATSATLLEHTTSREVLGERGFAGAVGYAGIVFN
jgi:AmmeMemoRadiSam system protein B